MAVERMTVHSLRDEEALWRLTAALGGSTTVSGVAEALATEGGSAAGGVFANVGIRLGTSSHVQVVHRSMLDQDPAAWRLFDVNESVPVCDCIRDGVPVLLGSEEEIRTRYPAVVAEIRSAGLSARAALPLHSPDGAVLGALGLGWQTPQDFGSGQLRRLDLIAQLAGLALDRALRNGSVEDEQGPLTEAIETMPNAFFSLDHDFRITHVNTEGARLLRASPDEITGQQFLVAFPEAAGTEFERQYRRAVAEGRTVTFEEYYAPLASWFEVHVWPSRHGLNVYFSDISDRRSVERRQTTELKDVKLANDRLRLVSEVASRLMGAENRNDVYQRLSNVVVPGMADWCTIVVPGDEELVRVAAVHRVPMLDTLAKRLVGSYPHRFDGPSPGVVVYRSGRPMRLDLLVRKIADELDDSIASAAYGRTLELLGDGPGLIVPVVSGEEVLAVITLIRSDGDPFTDADRDAMLEVASQVAIALKTADQHHRQRETALALLAAALPASLPSSVHLRLAARYQEASGSSHVGGDWYDAIELENGRVALVVGDVAGHGLVAASLTAQLRNALRAHLFAGVGPLESLTRLSRFLATQEPDALATIVCVEIDPVSGEARWASAGHPSPIVVRPNGTSAYLRGRAAPPICSAGPHVFSSGSEHLLTLQPGARLHLFTDGLFERKNSALDVGLAHLMIMVEQTQSEADLGVACDVVLEGMLTGPLEDDACLLVAEYAGPQ